MRHLNNPINLKFYIHCTCIYAYVYKFVYKHKIPNNIHYVKHKMYVYLVLYTM